MIRAVLAGLLLVSLTGSAFAQASPGDKAQDNPDAFERGFAVSLYHFDACGDPLAGRMFRRALADRFAHCPFSPGARTRFEQRTRAEQAKVRRIMENLIETNGGLPRELEGMSKTCHQQQGGDDYREFRSRLEQYAQGGLPADAILPAPCDAVDIVP